MKTIRKNFNKTYLLVAVVFLLIGFALGKQYTNKSLLRIAVSEQKALQSCQTAVDALNSQGESCIEAYRIFRTCVTGKACDLDAEGQKLQKLEEERKSAETILNQQSESIQQIMEELRSIK